MPEFGTIFIFNYISAFAYSTLVYPISYVKSIGSLGIAVVKGISEGWIRLHVDALADWLTHRAVWANGNHVCDLGRAGTVDYEYWLNQGWMKPQRDYYVRHTAGKTKVKLTRLAGAIPTPFVT
jgi:hypothetical protein